MHERLVEACCNCMVVCWLASVCIGFLTSTSMEMTLSILCGASILVSSLHGRQLAVLCRSCPHCQHTCFHLRCHAYVQLLPGLKRRNERPASNSFGAAVRNRVPWRGLLPAL